MKVFISWSGPLSHKVAIALKDWLPSVIQSIKPYVSSEDIYKGARWSTEIAKELAASTYGIICLTRDNLTAPWLNFEAGALAKALEKSYVAPFLFDLKPSDVEGPLEQFMFVLNEENDIYKMITDINSTLGSEDRLEDVPLRKYFDKWWPHLSKDLRAIHEDQQTKEPREEKTRRDPNEILEELLDLARTQQRLIALDVNQTLDYLEKVLKEISQLRMPYLVNANYDWSSHTPDPWSGNIIAAGSYPIKAMVIGEIPHGTVKVPVETRRREGETSSPNVNESHKTDEKKEKT